jgi:hypothetical protein
MEHRFLRLLIDASCHAIGVRFVGQSLPNVMRPAVTTNYAAVRRLFF